MGIINNNRWNKWRYTLYRPIYDLAGKAFTKYRKESIDALNLKSGEVLFIPGAGTGLDLELLPKDIQLIASDLTPAMVSKIKQRSQEFSPPARIEVMDAQNTPLENNSVDAIVLHLILAVVPDPYLMISEVERILKPGGRVSIMDKFVAPRKKASTLRRFANLFTSALATDITRDLYKIVDSGSLEIVHYKPLDSLFSHSLLKKPL